MVDLGGGGPGGSNDGSNDGSDGPGGFGGSGAARSGGSGPGAGRPGCELSRAEFAVWARHNHVRLPHPIDISQLPGLGTRPPEGVRELDLLAEVARTPRVSAFAMRTSPGTSTDIHVALASASRAVLVRVVGDRTSVHVVAEDQLAAQVANSLPERLPLIMRPVEVSEPDWDRFGILARQADPGAGVDPFVSRLADAGLPPNLARALLAAAREPVPVGILGAQSWAGTASGVLGPRYAAWFEYHTGTVLAERPPARGTGPRVLHVGPYSRQAAFYALAAAMRDALGRMSVER